MKGIQQTPPDSGFGLIVAVLAGEEFEGVQIWDALDANRKEIPFDASAIVSPIEMGTFWRAQTLAHFFPSLDEVLQLVDKGFYVCYRVHEAINREDFIQAIRILHDTSSENPEFPYLEYCTLLAAVIALAHALDPDSHKDLSCGKAMSQSLSYIAFAHANIENKLTSVTSLRAAVMVILFHLCTNNARSAFSFLSLACDGVVCLGLLDRYSRISKLVAEEDTPMQNLYWTVLYLDTYICGLLKKPPFLDISVAKNATLVVMQHAAENQSLIVRSPRELLLNVGLALSIELFDIQKRIANLSSYGKSSNKAQNIPIIEIRRLEKELDDFKVVCDAVFPPGEVVTVVARARFEVLMSFCVTSLMLGMRIEALMTGAKAAVIPGGHKKDILKRSHIIAAILAIDSATEYTKLPAHAPTSEPSAYALFISTLCLITAMSDTNDHDNRMHLATKVLTGFFLVSRMACPAYAATSTYIDYIYKLGHKCGAIPHMNNNIVTSRATSCIPQVYHPLNINVDWSFLPSYTNFDQNLLSMPVVHNTAPARLRRDATNSSTSSRSYYSPSVHLQEPQQTFLAPRWPGKSSSSSSSTHTASVSPIPSSIFSHTPATLSRDTSQSSTGITPTFDQTLSASDHFTSTKPTHNGTSNSEQTWWNNNYEAYGSYS